MLQICSVLCSQNGKNSTTFMEEGKLFYLHYLLDLLVGIDLFIQGRSSSGDHIVSVVRVCSRDRNFPNPLPRMWTPTIDPN